MKIPFSPPFIDQELKNELMEVVSSGWITTGPKVKELEAMMREFTQTQLAICVNSATSGILLALHYLGVGKGDEVIIPAYTYCATALTVMHVGAKPIMVDVDSDFTIDVQAVANAITPKTKAVMGVDFAGLPCKYNALLALLNSPEVKNLFEPKTALQKAIGRPFLLSDAAHGLGASYNNLPLGAIADCTIFSFHAVKNVTTAEGGCVVFNMPITDFDYTAAEKQLKLMHLNGQTKDAFTKNQAGGWRYDIVLPGFKINMPDICAVLGLSQLRKYKTELLPKRKSIFEAYNAFFGQFDWAILPTASDLMRTSCYHLYPLRIDGISEMERDQMIDYISQTGVSVNVHFIPLPMFTLFKQMGYDIADYPRTFSLYASEISLPIYPQLTNVQVDFICQQIAKAKELIKPSNLVLT